MQHLPNECLVLQSSITMKSEKELLWKTRKLDMSFSFLTHPLGNCSHSKAFLDNDIKQQYIFDHSLSYFKGRSSSCPGLTSLLALSAIKWVVTEGWWLRGTLRPPRNATGTLHVAHDRIKRSALMEKRPGGSVSRWSASLSSVLVWPVRLDQWVGPYGAHASLWLKLWRIRFKEN